MKEKILNVIRSCKVAILVLVDNPFGGSTPDDYQRWLNARSQSLF